MIASNLKPRSPRTRSVLRQGTIALAAATLGMSACGKPPELPPADSMEFISFQKGTAGALTAAEAGGSTTNVDVAAAAVGLVSLGVNAALLTPRLTFAAALSAKGQRDGDGWRWKKTLPLAGWDVDLYGEATDGLDLEMRVTGLRGEMANIQDFLWYTGAHQADHGVWTIFAPAKDGGVVTIDWARRAADDKDVTFTNVTTGEDGSGDVLAYAIDHSLASMSVHDTKDKDGNPADFSVVWHLTDGSGKMTANDTAYCWDVIANGQVDIDCPAGDYPMQ